MEWKKYIGKRIYVVLKNGFKYQGKVVGVDISGDETPVVVITIEDKYGKYVTFSPFEASLFKEEAY